MVAEADTGPGRAAGGAYARPVTAQQVVVDGVRRQVMTGELPPGSAIVQEDLAEKFGVSRVPVREALKRLEGEGVVSYQAHYGFRVTKLDIEELIEVYEMREWLETGLVRASIPRLARENLHVMQDAMRQMADAAGADDIERVGEQNRRFHFQLFEPAGLHRALRTVRQLWDTTDPYRPLYFNLHYDAATVNLEHEEIVTAAFAHDVGRTIMLLNLHRADAVRRLRELLGGRP